jgi:prepilin-type N-terminal cleavage/methylation domain-containing protein
MKHNETLGWARGFTLIELLIVVAIIAILAAIAVPNFLEAQTRSKVSRVKADQRSIATALESYAVDQNLAYPPTYICEGSRPAMKDWLARFIPLTTPVAYIASVPDDTFKIMAGTAFNYRAFNYDDAASYLCAGAGLPLYPWMPISFTYRKWQIVSTGPDLKLDWSALYDPTNGTISNGDIFRVGP